MDLLEERSSVGGFSQLLGMPRAIEACRKLGQQDSGAQTVLLYGVDEAGKTKLARELAHAWLCRKPTEEGACGVCDACGRTARQSQPDLLCISPAQPSNLIRISAVEGDEELGQVGIKQFVQMKPIGSRRKVIWIEKCDRMNAATANALLKTLEEPPPFVKIVMTAPAPSAVLTTIASRCLCIACSLPVESEFPEELDALERLFSFGAPERALQIRESRTIFEGILQIAERLPEAGPADVLQLSTALRQIADQYAKGDRSARQSLAECLESLAIASRATYPEAIPAIVEAHRRIIGNGSPAIVTTALFGSILVGQK